VRPPAGIDGRCASDTRFFLEIFMTLTSFLLWGATAYAFLPNWNALTARINADMQLIDSCGTTCPSNVVYLKKLADQAKAKQNPIAEINRIANYEFVYGTEANLRFRRSSLAVSFGNCRQDACQLCWSGSVEGHFSDDGGSSACKAAACS